jgi:16S rRNA (cytosine967-C5)-methyltransferase
MLRSKPFSDGSIIISDPAQSLAVRALKVSSGDIVIDLFAAPGGKTASLAGLVGSDGYVIAVDLSLKRIKLLKSNIDRWCLKNVFPVCGDALKFASGRNFKYILADAPCSGTGTIRRNADLRWNLQETEIKRQAKRQARLIEAAANMLQSGGRLVYSTCSLEPEENIRVVENFLKQNKAYRLIELHEFDKFIGMGGTLEVIPHRHFSDGAFVALIEKS